MSRRTPVFVLEEHHEAVLAWWHALKAEAAPLPVLIHVDQHADFGIPPLSEPVPPMAGNVEQIATFVYTQLTYGTFLLPAALMGFFRELVWIRPSRPLNEPTTRRRLRAIDDPPFVELDGVHTSGSVEFGYRSTSWRKLGEVKGSWLLDVCLDAFLCEDWPQAAPFRLEITKEEAERLSSASLNEWRMRYGGGVRIEEHAGRLWFELVEPALPAKEVTPAALRRSRARIATLGRFLRQTRQPPEAVTIIRSAKSGFTPPSAVPHLEAAVRAAVFDAYPSAYDARLPEPSPHRQ